MASDDFILEMYGRLHPGSDIHNVDDLTGEGVEEVMAIIDDKHAIKLGSDWISDEVVVELRMFDTILTSASLSAYAGLKEQDAKSIGDFQDGDGGIDREQIKDWEINTAYFKDQLAAIKRLEAMVHKLRDETHKPGFYMRGVEVDGKVGA